MWQTLNSSDEDSELQSGKANRRAPDVAKVMEENWHFVAERLPMQKVRLDSAGRQGVASKRERERERE